jgi:hypothetical protein
MDYCFHVSLSVAVAVAVLVCSFFAQSVFYLSGGLMVASNAVVLFLHLSKPPEEVEEEEEEEEEGGKEAKLEAAAKQQTGRRQSPSTARRSTLLAEKPTQPLTVCTCVRLCVFFPCSQWSVFRSFVLPLACAIPSWLVLVLLLVAVPRCRRRLSCRSTCKHSKACRTWRLE